MKIEVIEPHGFCGGVARALRMAHAALAGGTVYCLHEIVHNERVVAALAAKGMSFVETPADVPEGASLLISAHGTSPAFREAATARHLRIIDATCPFVAAAHAKIRANYAQGLRTVIIGTPSHAEVRGYLGEPGACLPADVASGEKTGCVVQTTLDASRHEGVCTATQDRQEAVRRFVERHATKVGVIVVGSAKSANTERLVAVAEQAGARAWRVGSPEEATALDVSGIDILGVTAGASTPEDLFRAVVEVML